MVKPPKLQIGLSDEPAGFAPSVNDCLATMLKQSDLLMTDVLIGLGNAASPTHAKRIVGFQQPALKLAIDMLRSQVRAVCEVFGQELSRLVYHGGGKDQRPAEVVRFEDLQLFEDSDLDQSIEVARAQQEVMHSVETELNELNALMSTVLGWRTIQPGLNPLRPEMFVRALQFSLAHYIADHSVRESLITPAAGLLGANLRRLYKEMCEWLRAAGVEPAVPLGGRSMRGTPVAAQASDSMTKTLLTLDKLRKLLSGDLDPHGGPRDFMHTVPASFVALQELRQVDVMVERLEKRPRLTHPNTVPDLLVDSTPAREVPRLGRQLGEEVVRLMFDNLSGDARLLPAFSRQLRGLEASVLALAKKDSRFFSDRTHPARMLLDRMTHRSLGFTQDSDEGAPRFMATVEAATTHLATHDAPDAERFGEVLDDLQAQWNEHDHLMRQRREEAARALLHAEQRNLLAQKLAVDFGAAVAALDVPVFVVDFLQGSWAQVVAEAQLSCADGSDDPYGYRALVDDLIWSVQKSTALRGRTRRLAELIPNLLSRLREGLGRIHYPDELTARFFDSLITIHEAALKEGRDAMLRAAAESLEAARVSGQVAEPQPWVAEQEALESGFLDDDSLVPDISGLDLGSGEFQDSPGPVPAAELRTGTWVELLVAGRWLRVQLTWASPHATLFMFTSAAGTAHSMSRRSLERLQLQGFIKVVAQRNVVDDALDQVVRTAMDNSLKAGGESEPSDTPP